MLKNTDSWLQPNHDYVASLPHNIHASHVMLRDCYLYEVVGLISFFRVGRSP